MRTSYLMRCLSIFVIAYLITSAAFGQNYYCRQRALSSLRPLPKLSYSCPADVNDSDEELLRLPSRIAAINKYKTRLATFSTAAWWSSTVADLTYCDIHKKAGKLSTEEIGQLRNAEYTRRIFGDGQIRMVSVADPCFMGGYGGSNIFVLYRSNGSVHATEVIDGFFSRADDPIDIDFAATPNGRVIEIASSTGGLNPMVINRYFSVDTRTGRAVPAPIFKIDGKRTNTVTSMMLLEDAEDYGLPAGTEPLVIIKNGKLARSFSIIHDNGETSANDRHPIFSRKVMKWNGKFFE